MAKKYGIIGTGGASDKAIIAALNDLDEEATFICHKEGKTTPSQATIWNWLIDNERDFDIYGTNLGKDLVKYADNSGLGSAEDVIDKADEVLVLFDDTPGIEDLVVYAAKKGKKMLELSNGLNPIEVEDDEDEAPAPVAERDEEEGDESDEAESTDFTRDELEAMPAAAVKRYAKDRGIDITGQTKADIINMLFLPAVDMDSLLADAPEVEKTLAAEVVDKGIRPSVSQIIVVYNNGTTATFNGNASVLQNMIATL